MASHSSSSIFPSSVQSSTLGHFNINQNKNTSISISCSLLQKSLVPGLPLKYYYTNNTTRKKSNSNSNSSAAVKIRGSLIDNPILWAGRLCGFYALCKAGFAGSQSNPILSGSGSESEMNDDVDLGFSKWLEKFQKNPDKEAADKRKLVSKWHPTTKGTLRRNYRIPSKPEGRRLLKAIASLLSEDDHFVDAESHKGCQIRRESAHGESVCCNNVRALFDELPTPHLIVEITPFPAGSLTHNDYAKAEKLEKVLRSSPSV